VGCIEYIHKVVHVEVVNARLWDDGPRGNRLLTRTSLATLSSVVALTQQMNLSLYSVNAFIVLDTDGHRVVAKYYSPKGRSHSGNPDPNKGLQNLKEQRAFEKGLFSKTKKNFPRSVSTSRGWSNWRLKIYRYK
jgi:hypothetical protein